MSLNEYYAQTFTTDDLKELLNVVDAPKKPTRKDERVEMLVRTLTSRRDLQFLWDRISDIERKALAAAYHNDGIFNPAAFLAQYGQLPQRPRRDRWGYSSTLYALDLFFVGMTRYGAWQNYAIHPELMPLLEPIVPPPDRFELHGTQETPSTALSLGREFSMTKVETEARGPHDLLLFLALLHQNEIKYSNSGEQLTKKSLETLTAKLAAVNADEANRAFLSQIRATGLIHFARSAGLVNGQGNLTETGKAYLATESPEILFDAFLEWSEKGTFDEIKLISGIRGTGAKGVRLSPPSMRRERIVEALSWAPTGVWISTVELYRAIQIWHMDFDVEEGGIDRLYVGRYTRSGYYTEPWADYTSAWYFIKGLYINAVIWAFLASIGAVDILYAEDAADFFPANTLNEAEERPISDYDGLAAFRITPLGAYLFGQASGYAPLKSADEAFFSISAEGVIVLLPGVTLSEAHRAQMEQITDATPQGYILSPQKLLVYLESSQDLGLPRTFLTQRNRGPLPNEVTRLLDQIEEDSHAVTITGRMLSISVRSAEIAQQILDDPVAGKIARQLDSRTLLIPEGRQTAFRNALRSLGYGLRE